MNKLIQHYRSWSKREQLLSVSFMLILLASSVSGVWGTATLVVTPSNLVVLDGAGNLVIGGNVTGASIIGNHFYWSNGTELGGGSGGSGSPGVPGSVWYNGSGVPDSGLGISGDYYLRLDNGWIYNKIVTTWTYVMNVTGPQGIQGLTGLTGATGPAGADFNATGTTHLFNGTDGANGSTQTLPWQNITLTAPQSFSYLITTSGPGGVVNGSYFCVNGSTNQYVASWTSTNEITVTNNVYNNLPYNGKVVFVGNFSSVPSSILPSNNSITDATQAEFRLANNVNSSLVYIPSNATGIEIYGGYWDGNAANNLGYAVAGNGHIFEVAGTNVKIHDTNATNAMQYVFDIDNTNDITIQNNYIFNGGGDDDISIHAVNRFSVDHNTIMNHTNRGRITGVVHSGIELEDGCQNGIVQNNVVWANNDTAANTAGYMVKMHSGVSTPNDNIQLINNLAYGIGRYGYYFYGETPTYLNGEVDVINCKSAFANAAGCYFTYSNNVVFYGGNFSNARSGGLNGAGFDFLSHSNNVVAYNTLFSGNAGFDVILEASTCTNVQLFDCALTSATPIDNSGAGTLMLASSNGFFDFVYEGQAAVAGQVLFGNSSGFFKANSVSTTAVSGSIVLATVTTYGAINSIVLKQGDYTNPAWSWTVGGAIYVSNSTAGALTQTMPLSSGNVVLYVGYAISATTMYFDPHPDSMIVLT